MKQSKKKEKLSWKKRQLMVTNQIQAKKIQPPSLPPLLLQDLRPNHCYLRPAKGLQCGGLWSGREKKTGDKRVVEKTAEQVDLFSFLKGVSLIIRV